MPAKKYIQKFRTLDNSIPEIKRYLGRGMDVLDVGCGRGEITCGVAEYVDPGKTTGLDPDPDCIADAIEAATSEEDGMNVDFLVGDSHELPFEDNSFEIVYSYTVLHFLIDPILALKEQKRVVKPGGWVIAIGVRDPLSIVRFSHCPNWEKAWIALSNYYEEVRNRYRSSKAKPSRFMEEERKKIDSFMMTYTSWNTGRKCAGWFKQIGLRNLEICVTSDNVIFHDSFRFKPGSWDLLPRVNPEDKDYDESAIQKPLDDLYAKMVESGELEQKVLDDAVKEVVAWYKNPEAFSFFPIFFAAGQK